MDRLIHSDVWTYRLDSYICCASQLLGVQGTKLKRTWTVLSDVFADGQFSGNVHEWLSEALIQFNRLRLRMESVRNTGLVTEFSLPSCTICTTK